MAGATSCTATYPLDLIRCVRRGVFIVCVCVCVCMSGGRATVFAVGETLYVGGACRLVICQLQNEPCQCTTSLGAMLSLQMRSNNFSVSRTLQLWRSASWTKCLTRTDIVAECKLNITLFYVYRSRSTYDVNECGYPLQRFTWPYSLLINCCSSLPAPLSPVVRTYSLVLPHKQA